MEADRLRIRETLSRLGTRLERAEMLLDESAKSAAVLPQILSELSKLRVELVSAATKSEHVPVSALLSVSKVYNGVLKTMCAVLAAIIMWLTGAKSILNVGFADKSVAQTQEREEAHH